MKNLAECIKTFIYFNTKFVIAKLLGALELLIRHTHFNTKFVIAKSSINASKTGVNFRFQYKICYSKIFLWSICKMFLKYFNTKFVIAKSKLTE